MAVESKLSDHVVTGLWGYTWRKVLQIQNIKRKARTGGKVILTQVRSEGHAMSHVNVHM